MKYSVVRTPLILLLLILSHTVNADNNPTSAEVVAQKYMTAFFHGDISTAADLLHPDFLARFHREFHGEIARYKGDENNFLAEMGIKQKFNIIKGLSPKELFILVIESDHKRNMKAFNMMKATKVTISGTEALNQNTVRVNLTVTTPAKTRPLVQLVGLWLAKYENQWRVLATPN